MGVKRVLQEKLPEGVHDGGVTLTGFLLLNALFIEKRCPDRLWTILRRFGYIYDIKLSDPAIRYSMLQAPDEVISFSSNCCRVYTSSDVVSFSNLV